MIIISITFFCYAATIGVFVMYICLYLFLICGIIAAQAEISDFEAERLFKLKVLPLGKIKLE